MSVSNNGFTYQYNLRFFTFVVSQAAAFIYNCIKSPAANVRFSTFAVYVVSASFCSVQKATPFLYILQKAFAPPKPAFSASSKYTVYVPAKVATISFTFT